MKTRTSQARAVCPSVRISMNWQLSVEKTVTGFGYELIECERGSQGLLRVFIDRVSGQAYDTGESEFVTVEDCEKVTRQLQYVLEVDGLDYSRLEVSSPGLDRPLRHEADYRRFAGRLAKIVTAEPVNGQSAFAGRLKGMDGGLVLLEEGRKVHRVPVGNIKRARLDVEF